jgi:hypothetical protein
MTRPDVWELIREEYKLLRSQGMHHFRAMAEIQVGVESIMEEARYERDEAVPFGTRGRNGSSRQTIEDVVERIVKIGNGEQGE